MHVLHYTLFGIAVDKDKEKREGEKYLKRVDQQHKCFIEKIRYLRTKVNDCRELDAALKFVSSIKKDEIEADPLWEESKKQVFLMCLADSNPVCEVVRIKDAIIKDVELKSASDNTIRCLVTGEEDALSRLEPNITGVKDANTMGAHIVSVNNKVSNAGNGGATPAFASYGKEQGENSPIGRKASLAYSTALNSLLERDSSQKITVGDATAVFWSEKDSVIENEFLDLFGEPARDNPDKGVEAVERLLSSVKSGSFSHEKNTNRFYILGLSPNSARISVRFWHHGTVAEMEQRFADWFEDLRIVHSVRDKEHLSLWRLLVSTAAQGKSENINPNLAGSIMRSILNGGPLPDTLRSAVLVRIKAERDVSYPRVKLLKAYLNRKHKERKITMSLDNQNTNPGYRLGRLFATLEKIQEEANPKINTTIRDKFYASASSSPNTVFGNLMRLKNHHLGKLKQGRSVYFEKIFGEIFKEVSSFPAHLSLDDQGQFAIGYYHQRQDFFTKKEKVDTGDEE